MQFNNLDDDAMKILGAHLRCNQTLEELDISVPFPFFI